MRPQALFSWFTPVASLKFVGPAAVTALTRLLRPTRVVEESEARAPIVRDLLFHLPASVVDRRVVTPVAQLKPGHYASVQVTIAEHGAPPRKAPRRPYQVAAYDDSGQVMLTFFNVKGDYLTRTLPVGSTQIICGTMEFYHGVPTIAHPDVMADVRRADAVLRLTPEYPLTAGISQRVLGRAMEQGLAFIKPLPEWLDAAFVSERKFPGFTAALTAIHRPNAAADILPDQPPRMRLAYDELLANQLALGLARRLEQRQPAYPIAPAAEVEAKWRAALPFTLTAGQEQVLGEIQTDMASGQRMVRLLQGDVGSGKTILAFGAMAQAVAGGFQACLMAPTDLLARQHLASLQPLADAVGYNIALLSGKMKKSEQASLREQIAAGSIDLVVGTHALFQDDVAFKNLALIVVDEQHRFGVSQRMKLAGKGCAPHLLQMTATPIPRSLTMTLYGDMDISALTERPPGRREIDTRAVPAARMAEVIDGLARIIEAGEKAYWVCPLIEATESPLPLAGEGQGEGRARTGRSVGNGANIPSPQPSPASGRGGFPDLAAAEERFAELSRRFPGKVGLIHGRMKLPEREQVMQDYTQGHLQLLVATTVIEVGVNVPEATVMVVEHAERFGLAQLHQLRGRVGRSHRASRCILLYHDPLSETAKSRLRILRETNDGFLIAEEDLRLRGGGDMLGMRQTGMPDFILADLAHHLPLIRIAHDDAKLILHRDPELLSERGRALRLLLGLFEYDAAMAQLKGV